MKFNDVKELTSMELRKRSIQLREELFESRMKQTLGQLGNALEIRFKRRDLARLMTALQMKLGTSSTKKVKTPARANKKG
jgi:large subunit ribosomal protein L29